MDRNVVEFFQPFSGETPHGKYHKAIILNDAPDYSCEDICRLVSTVPKGWLELAAMTPEERLDMLRDFWLMTLPYSCHLLERVNTFFGSLEDVGVVIFQKKFDDPWEGELVYSLKSQGGFFRGAPPATESQLLDLQKWFPETILPEDYKAFMRIHSGFSKGGDTGIIPVEQVGSVYEMFQRQLSEREALVTQSGKPVNPKSLIPFYESFGMPFYQCFWSEWYPESEMGTVYYSGNTHVISNVDCADPGSDQMAFNTFTDWLFFYLEKIT